MIGQAYESSALPIDRAFAEEECCKMDKLKNTRSQQVLGLEVYNFVIHAHKCRSLTAAPLRLGYDSKSFAYLYLHGVGRSMYSCLLNTMRMLKLKPSYWCYAGFYQTRLVN